MSLARVAAPARSSLARAAPAAGRRAFTTQKAGAIPVAAVDDGSATASVTVAVRAGPRYETTPGVANALKHFLFKSTSKRSALRLVRESELYGGLLSATLSKENLYITAEFLRGDEDYFVEVLGDVLASSKFPTHEFNEEVLPAIRGEYEQVSSVPSVFGFDVLTQTAYRQRGLGASLFASPASPISVQDTVSYGRAAFSKSNIAVLGTGVDASKLSGLVSKSFADIPSSSTGLSAGPSTYHGGEQRVAFAPHHAESSRSGNGHFFLGFQGAPTPEFAVLRSLLGGESSVKWSSGLSPLSKITEKVSGASAEAFNIAFSDSGLVGAYVSAPHPSLTSVAKEVGNAFKSVASGVSSEDLQRAIAKAKFEAASALESRETVRDVVGSALLSQSGDVQALDKIFSQLESVSANQVSSAAEKALKGKATTVAIGDVHVLPYADDVL
ncbi:unnamed protein product [Parajaminaea phylloscopi]